MARQDVIVVSEEDDIRDVTRFFLRSVKVLFFAKTTEENPRGFLCHTRQGGTRTKERTYGFLSGCVVPISLLMPV